MAALSNLVEEAAAHGVGDLDAALAELQVVEQQPVPLSAEVGRQTQAPRLLCGS